MEHSVPRRWESLTFSAFFFVCQVLVESQKHWVHNLRGTPQTHTMRRWRISRCRYVMMAKHRVLPPHYCVQGGAQCVSQVR